MGMWRQGNVEMGSRDLLSLVSEPRQGGSPRSDLSECESRSRVTSLGLEAGMGKAMCSEDGCCEWLVGGIRGSEVPLVGSPDAKVRGDA